MVIGINQVGCSGTYLGQSPGHLGAPLGVGFVRVACAVEAFDKGIGDDSTLISVERKCISDQARGVRCHAPECTPNGGESPVALWSLWMAHCRHGMSTASSASGRKDCVPLPAFPLM